VTDPDDPLQLRGYVTLLDDFLAGRVGATDFDLAFFRLQGRDRVLRGDPWYPILQDLFYACEDYVIQPELRTEPGDLDEAQLLDAARTARARLAALGV
jgi:hypothetical protein